MLSAGRLLIIVYTADLADVADQHDVSVNT